MTSTDNRPLGIGEISTFCRANPPLTRFSIDIYEDYDGKCPYDLWLSELDTKTAARIEARVSRFRLGNFGDHKKLVGAEGL